MIDLHCHYLPGVDDGAETLGDGLALCRAAVDNGITEAVLTPHVHPGRYDNTRTSLEPRFNSFRQAVEEAGIPLKLHLAGEVRLLPESLELIARGELPLLGRWQNALCALIEFPHDKVPVGAFEAIAYLRRRGVCPVIAHPERNRAIMRDCSLLQPFVAARCLLQLTAGSVCGTFGSQAQAAAHEIIESGWATVVATDSHNLDARPPNLREAHEYLARRYGPALADRLTCENPKTIAAGNMTDRRG